MSKNCEMSGNTTPLFFRLFFRFLTLMIAASIALVSLVLVIRADDSVAVVSAPVPDCRSAILMEASTGKILYEKNANEALPPASVTKIMTLLIIMEAIEAGRINYSDMVTASAHACSMGGSQIYLKEGEQMSVEDLIKSIVIASANDAAVALAEFVSGSESAFVTQMNERARALGMENTNFENTNGLDDTSAAHLTSAKDIAIMSRELIKHKKITEYSSIWMDTIRDGSFGLTNTNRLVRFYKGATGLKTGSTSKAGFCISATAERDGMTLICVIMGASTRDIRNAAATALLDWGFANFTTYTSPTIALDNIRVMGGKRSQLTLVHGEFSDVLDKKCASGIEYVIELPEYLDAPVEKGQKVGIIRYRSQGADIGYVDICAGEKIEKIEFFDVLLMIICAISIN